jgi:hemerythrin-like domain-containing protein
MEAEVVGDLIRIHTIMTRGLAVSIDHGRSFLKERRKPDEFRGFIMYLRCLTSMLHAHHLTEDEVAFPYFKKFLPDIPYESLTKQHKLIGPNLDKVNEWMNENKESLPAQEIFTPLISHLEAIQAVWLPHIQLEESQFSEENLAPVIDMNDRIQIGKLLANHSRSHQQGGIEMLAFVLYNMKPEDREMIATTVPWFLRKVLLNGLLKNQWKPIRPYLLSD